MYVYYFIILCTCHSWKSYFIKVTRYYVLTLLRNRNESSYNFLSFLMLIQDQVKHSKLIFLKTLFLILYYNMTKTI